MRGSPVTVRGKLLPPRKAIPVPIVSPFSLPQTTLEMISQLKAMHEQVLTLITSLETKHENFDKIKQGPPGIGLPGLDADHATIVRDVVKQIRQPQDGKSPAVEAIAAALYPLVLGYVKKNLPPMPTATKIEVPKPIDPAEIVEAFFAALEKGDKKIKIGQIDGLDTKFAEVRNAAALGSTPEIYGKNTWARGGGDTVVAGSGVTIVETVDGTKKISASSSGFNVIAVTGTINDSNLIFNAASQPTLLNINGAFYQQTGGAITWTYVAGVITLSSPVGTGGSIYGIA